MTIRAMGGQILIMISSRLALLQQFCRIFPACGDGARVHPRLRTNGGHRLRSSLPASSRSLSSPSPVLLDSTDLPMEPAWPGPPATPGPEGIRPMVAAVAAALVAGGNRRWGTWGRRRGGSRTRRRTRMGGVGGSSAATGGGGGGRGGAAGTTSAGGRGGTSGGRAAVARLRALPVLPGSRAGAAPAPPEPAVG